MTTPTSRIPLSWSASGAPATQQLIEFFQGDDVLLTFTALTPTATTAWSAAFVCRDVLSGAVLYNVAAVNTDAVNGVFTVTLAAALSVAAAPLRNYQWDFRRTDSGASAELADGYHVLQPSGAAASRVAPATQLRVALSAAPATAGVGLVATVTALDAGGNVVTPYPGTVHLTSTDGQAVLGADATLVNGVGLFPVTLKTVGTQTVTATDTATGSINGVAQGTVQAAAASKLTLGTQPAAANSGQMLYPPPTLSVQDAYGNLVASSPAVVSVALNGTGGTLSGTTALAVVGGIASFTDLAIDLFGTYTLTFTASGLAPVTTASFTVAPGAALFASASSRYLSRANPALLSPGSSAFSVAAWVKMASKPAAASVIASKGLGTGNQREWFLGYGGTGSSDAFKANVSTTGTGYTGLSATTFGAPALNTWYLVVMTYDQSTIKISVNAGTQDTFALVGPVFQGTADFNVGAINGGTASFWDGAVGRLAYFSRALSAADITTLFGLGKSFQYSELPGSLLTNLTGWWNLGELAGTTRLDSTANHLDLTDHNTVGLTTGPQPGAASMVAAKLNYLSRTNPALLSPGATPFTVCCWVNHNTVTALGQGIVQKYNGVGNQKEWGLQRLATQFGGGWKFILSPDGLANDGPQTGPVGDIVPQTWYFLCATFAPNDARISYNAGAQVQYTAFASLFQGTADFTFGQLIGTNSTIWLDGAVGPVGFWLNRVFSTSEITTMYNLGRSIRFNTLPAAFLTNLTEFWDDTDAAGATRLGMTSNHLDLTDHNGCGLVAGPP